MKEEIRAVEFGGGRNPPEGAREAIVSPSERSPSVAHAISFFTVSRLSGFKQPDSHEPHPGRAGRKGGRSASEGDTSAWDSAGSGSFLPNIWLQ